MWNWIISAVGATIVLTGGARAGDMTRGLTIDGGQNALAVLKMERVNDPAADRANLTVRLSLSDARSLQGYGLTLQYTPDTYEFLEARQLSGSLLAARADQEPLFLTSNPKPGELIIGAMKVDGHGASGEGTLVDLVFRASGTPLASDFQLSESVLVGLDGGVDLLTRVEIGDLTPLPEHYGLYQNMPNPFNPSTTIGYALPKAGRVRMTIYNLLGQEVRVLVDEKHDAGSLAAVWDGTDATGRRVASGVYLYRIQAGEFKAVRRMLLLK